MLKLGEELVWEMVIIHLRKLALSLLTSENIFILFAFHNTRDQHIILYSIKNRFFSFCGCKTWSLTLGKEHKITSV